MKKKNLFILILVVVLAFTLGMGTLAYYTKTFASNNNVVRAARFEVDDDGTLAKDIIFDLDKDPLYPGRNMDVYNFKIEKNNTEVPVKYDINVVGLDPLFAGNSPVSLTVLRKTGDVWTNFTGTELTNPEAVEEFKINLNWAHGDNDIDYQGKPGKININVVATQVDKEVPPIEPEPDQLEVAEAKAYLIGLGDKALRNDKPAQLNFVQLKTPSGVNSSMFTFLEEFAYGDEIRQEGYIRVYGRDTTIGQNWGLSATRDESNDYTVQVKLLIVKGEFSDVLTYEISVPKNGKRSDPITGEPSIPAGDVSVRLLP